MEQVNPGATIRPRLRSATVAFWLILGLILAAFAYLAFGPRSVQTSVTGGPVAVGAPAPDFTTQTLDGGSVQLSNLVGKPVLVNFWATWCYPCQVEMPDIERSWERHRSQGLQVVAVNFKELNRSAMHAFLKKLGVRFPVALDMEGKIATAYNVSVGLPTSIFVDRHGIVRTIHLGQMTPS